jgi:hypothetical protein
MERVRINYSINIANKVGVQDVIYGKMYLHTSNINSENELMDKVTEAMENIMVELDFDILGGCCKVMSGEEEILKLDFYSHENLDDGESRWIEPTMKTIH